MPRNFTFNSFVLSLFKFFPVKMKRLEREIWTMRYFYLYFKSSIVFKNQFNIFSYVETEKESVFQHHEIHVLFYKARNTWLLCPRLMDGKQITQYATQFLVPHWLWQQSLGIWIVFFQQKHRWPLYHS